MGKDALTIFQQCPDSPTFHVEHCVFVVGAQTTEKYRTKTSLISDEASSYGRENA
jgi:hypothetical protein